MSRLPHSWFFRLLRVALGPFLALAGARARRRLGRWLISHPVPRALHTARPRVCFVTTWYGSDLGSGAESDCYRLVQSLRAQGSFQVEVATTTLKSFSADWNKPFHLAGTQEIDGVRVHRFHPERRRRFFFRVINRLFLMRPGWSWGLGRAGEIFYLDHMIWSSELLQFLERERENFDYFFYIPYLHSSSLLGINQTGGRSVLIPCLHDEAYARLDVVKAAFEKSGLVLFLAHAERALAQSLFGLASRPEQVIGAQVSFLQGDAERFRKRYGIEGPFLLYVGRKLPGKRLPELVESFLRFRRQNASALTLVIVGSGVLSFANTTGVRDLGFVSENDKVDAMAAAVALCQPSLMESFSLVLMEAWVQGTPALVARGSAVTEEHCQRSRGGLLYGSDQEFAEAVSQVLDPVERRELGERGKLYVESQFSDQKILENLMRALALK